MKVLLVTYYWPPAGGSGVQRWLKFIKYLPSFDIEPVVYTALNAEYTFYDESLLTEVPNSLKVVREKIWEPNSFLSKFKKGGVQSGGFLKSDPSFVDKMMHYIRANYFIPDARKFWIKPSVRRLVKLIEDNKIDLIITTGPPHSLHLIGLDVKRKTGVKWVADFRDPWTNIDYFHNLPLTKGARQKHYELETTVLSEADAVLVVGNSMKQEFADRSKQIHVVSNGFDDQHQNEEVMLDKKFSISHIGMMNADRNPKVFWRALRELIDESDDFGKDICVKLIGKCDQEVYKSIDEFELKDYVNFVTYVAHKDVLKFQKASQMLLLAVNNVPAAKSVITGKVFEYLQSLRPIIGIGPVDGDLAEILNDTGAGKMFDFNDLSSLKEHLLHSYHLFKSKGLNAKVANIDRYHRKNLTRELSEILKGLV